MCMCAWVCGGKVLSMPEETNSTKKHSTLKDYAKAESMIQLAIALPAGCLIGWLVGEALDKHFHTTWIGIVGIVLGAVGGFVQIFTTASRYLKRGGD
jgi:ATP synthase protein I